MAGAGVGLVKAMATPTTAQEKSPVVLYADFTYRNHVWSERRTTTTRSDE
jgi:hypothetical protein